MKRIFTALAIVALISLWPLASTALAQTYYFSVPRQIVDVYWEQDGTMRLEYEITLANDVSADPMEFVDIGLPTMDVSLSQARASIDGQALSHIAPSEYVDGAIEVGLGAYAIPPGQTGTLRVSIPGIRNVLYEGDEEGYASGLFSPNFFDSDLVYGTTDLTVAYHLPPGVQPEEPRWHEAPDGWPHQEPRTGLDPDGRIRYVWNNPSASPDQAYVFGASFPASYVPAAAVLDPNLAQRLNIDMDVLVNFCCFGGIGLIVLGFILLGARAQRKRKLDYLPPKISIEGHGIKRGLTAVEAAILLETPLDRVLTMILFALIKKGAVQVVDEDPLTIEKLSPEPAGGLRPYEKGFIAAMLKDKKRERQEGLQKLTIDLVKSVQTKMKGFSAKETMDYYRSIMKKAWAQVEAAETPEVKSERYADSLEWTMLDRDFDDRTRRTFRTGPVYVPTWWGLYRPTYRTSTGPSVAPAQRVTVSHSKGGSMPSLPGADFAASMVAGVQRTAGGLVSNLTDFTSGVTKTTNPPPPPSKSGGSWGGGGGGSCACACACAGCACACAGGGR